MPNRIAPIACLLPLAANLALGQGTVTFNNDIPGQVIAPIYGPEPGDPSVRRFGNTATGFPAGTQSYSGSLLSGPTWSAQLLGAPGNAPEASLVAISPVTTFRSGAGVGFIVPITFVPTGIPVGTTQATVLMAVWDNASGQFPDWQAAEAGWNSGVIAAGKSSLYAVPQLGGQTIYLRSFNVAIIPEPSIAMLLGLGAICTLSAPWAHGRSMPTWYQDQRTRQSRRDGLRA